MKIEKCGFTLCLAIFIFYVFASDGGETPQSSICSWMYYPNTFCPRFNFLCLNNRCIDRKKFCDGRNDCGDNSDERFCSGYSGCQTGMKLCPRESRCIYNKWFCDGIQDCNLGGDENNCDGIEQTVNELYARESAVSWMNKQKNSQSVTDQWGSFVDKYAVALFLSSNISTNSSRETRTEMANEISIKLLSRLTEKKLQDIPSNDLASYVNAFLVTCLDPRNFYGVDIVQELRSRVDGQNYTNPYVLLSMCNAGETMTSSDTWKLIEAFRANLRNLWTDVQSIAVMALACASRQRGSDVTAKMLKQLTLELKQLQYRNGTIGNLQTTALVMQAILSAAPEEDPDNFDHMKAVQQILAMQKDDGSFGSFQNTYYVLPVLTCQSLVNISSKYCERQPHKKDEKSELEDLINKGGTKIQVDYFLWIGDQKNVERQLTLYVPANTSFYRIMEMAPKIDSRYSFKYVMKDGKPYVTAISDYQDDPERGMFWNFYPRVKGVWTISKESPADIIVKTSSRFLMWYRSEST